MKYYNVLKDILTYYSGTITDIEKEYVYKILFIIKDKKDETISNVIIIFINNILRKIWDLSLTNIKTYKTGDIFCFLTRDIKFYFCIDSLSAKSKTDNEYSLITEKDIANMNLNTVGNIVEINYEGSIRTEPLLPIYFKDGKRKIEDLSCNTLGSFSLNNTFISSTNDLLIEEKKNLPIIYIDKLLFWATV